MIFDGLHVGQGTLIAIFLVLAILVLLFWLFGRLHR